MKVKIVIGVGIGVGVLVLCIWLSGLVNGPGRVDRRAVSVAASKGKDGSGDGVSGTGTLAGVASAGPGAELAGGTNLQAKSGAQQASGASPLISAYAEVIGDKSGGLKWYWKAGALPRMDRQTQQWVIEQFNQTEGLTNKGAHLFLIASKGDLDGARFIWHLLTEGLAGQEVTPAEEVILLVLPEELGKSARFHPEIIAWLEEGARDGYWERARSWVSKDAAGANRALRVMCVKGLGQSGRTEGVEALRRVRQLAEAAGDPGLVSEIADAAAENAMVARYGDAWFTGEAYGHSVEQYGRMITAWSDTPEGAEWSEASRRVSGIKPRRVSGIRP